MNTSNTMIVKKKHRFSKFALAVKTAAVMLGLTAALQTVPVHADVVYKAKEGDTFYSIALNRGINLQKLMNANPNIKPTNIYGGLSIKIPSSSSASVTASASASPIKITSASMIPSLNVFADKKVVEAWGKYFDYTKVMNVKATAYSSDPSENGWGPVDYFGNKLKLGTIAVDPKVIPMGTKVLVTEHTHAGLPKNAYVATATDQGSAIKGNKIDIFIPGSKASVNTFGIQNVKLYILN